MKVVALKPHVYGGKERQTGEEYTLEHKSHLALLLKLGRVEAPATSKKPKAGYKTRDMKAE